jgi:hypothetical protein
VHLVIDRNARVCVDAFQSASLCLAASFSKRARYCAYLLVLKRSDVSTRTGGVRGGVDDEMTVETMAPRLNARTAPMQVKP